MSLSTAISGVLLLGAVVSLVAGFKLESAGLCFTAQILSTASFIAAVWPTLVSAL